MRKSHGPCLPEAVHQGRTHRALDDAAEQPLFTGLVLEKVRSKVLRQRHASRRRGGMGQLNRQVDQLAGVPGVCVAIGSQHRAYPVLCRPYSYITPRINLADCMTATLCSGSFSISSLRRSIDSPFPPIDSIWIAWR